MPYIQSSNPIHQHVVFPKVKYPSTEACREIIARVNCRQPADIPRSEIESMLGVDPYEWCQYSRFHLELFWAEWYEELKAVVQLAEFEERNRRREAAVFEEYNRQQRELRAQAMQEARRRPDYESDSHRKVPPARRK